jgi:hypothetical protein
MKQLNKEEFARIRRELDEAPALVRWFRESRDENRVLLEGSPIQDIPGIQGENKTLNEVLNKIPKR